MIKHSVSRYSRSVNNIKNSILIIGKGTTYNNINKIVKAESLKWISDVYGKDSEIKKVSEEILDISEPELYIANIQEEESIVEILSHIYQYSFSYIVPINIFVSDFYYDIENNKVPYYIKLLENSSSKIVITDKHASLFEDIDTYLDYMKDLSFNIKNNIYNKHNIDPSNIYFVANILKNYEYSNAVLAAQLCQDDISEYPGGNTYIGNCVFNIDSFDIGLEEIIYFKDHIGKNTTIENLVNFRYEKDMQKFIFIDRIVDYFKNSLDISDIKGRLITNYQRSLIEKRIDEVFKSTVGWILQNYKIEKIDVKYERNFYIVIETEVIIQPVNSVEILTIKVRKQIDEQN